jgi:hypothetical protein
MPYVAAELIWNLLLDRFQASLQSPDAAGMNSAEQSMYQVHTEYEVIVMNFKNGDEKLMKHSLCYVCTEYMMGMYFPNRFIGMLCAYTLYILCIYSLYTESR